jgi:hypothetical protein
VRAWLGGGRAGLQSWAESGAPARLSENNIFLFIFNSNLHKQPQTSNLNRKKKFSQDGPKIKVV